MMTKSQIENAINATEQHISKLEREMGYPPPVWRQKQIAKELREDKNHLAWLQSSLSQHVLFEQLKEESAS